MILKTLYSIGLAFAPSPRDGLLGARRRSSNEREKKLSLRIGLVLAAWFVLGLILWLLREGYLRFFG
jgi:hypothetical protein